ncbi:predicted protein, partial [Nematostella vectensis]
GVLVWSKLKGYDWWPGRVVTYMEAGRPPPGPGNHWVKWFGDNKFSQVTYDTVLPFAEFKSNFLVTKMKGLYKKAVLDALEVLKKKLLSKDTETPAEPDEPLSEEEKCDAMVNWALTGFQPQGASGFAPTLEETIFLPPVSSDSDEEEADQTVNGSESTKGRFGKPVKEPNLVQDIKGTCMVFKLIMYVFMLDICLACGDCKVYAQHPLFEGGLCKECKQSFLECTYLFDEDGYQASGGMYCTICGDGQEVFMCDNEGCFRSYCGPCLEMLAGRGTVREIASREKWICYMCSGKGDRLIHRRKDWQSKLHELFLSDREKEYDTPIVYPVVAPEDRKPIRVLALFDGIATGLQALNELGIVSDKYYSAEIDEQAIQVTKVNHGDRITHLGDIKDLTESQIRELGPFDLVIGGSPCQDLSIANPARRGIFEGSGRLFFEFFRLLMHAKPSRTCPSRPFFWLFENVVGMRAEDKKTISRFLQSNPVVVDAKEVSPAHRPRYFWGNLPGMNRPAIPLPGDRLTLQECLEPNCGRKARFTKVQTITTNANSLTQTKKNILPVAVNDDGGQEREDILWCTEMERLFGFPSHYTDVNNMGRTQRQRLLGNAWSVPVVRHLLSPLKDYFKCT